MTKVFVVKQKFYEGKIMWTKQFFGTDFYHLVAAFMVYSVLGWLVESIYMSICNRKLTNRGFAFSPFCPIYGFGGVIGYMILRPLVSDLVKLYVCGAIIATVFEYLVALLMNHLFGEVWWDYHEKPLNYKGVICLESTIAWGFYAIIIVKFLHTRVIGFIDTINPSIGIQVIRIVFVIVTIDYIYHLAKALRIDMEEYRKKAVSIYKDIRTRW